MSRLTKQQLYDYLVAAVPCCDLCGHEEPINTKLLCASCAEMIGRLQAIDDRLSHKHTAGTYDEYIPVASRRIRITEA